MDEGIRKESKDATRGRSKYEDIQEICGREGLERRDQEGRKAIGRTERSFFQGRKPRECMSRRQGG